MDFLDNITEVATESGSVILMAGFGGVVHYLFILSKKKTVKIDKLRLTINFIFAVFIGFLLHQMMPPDLRGRGAIIMIGGFLAEPTLLFIEKRGLAIVQKIIGLNGGPKK